MAQGQLHHLLTDARHWSTGRLEAEQLINPANRADRAIEFTKSRAGLSGA